ncbi:MAG: M28 family peptidase [Tenuifilaceae bacterium]
MKNRILVLIIVLSTVISCTKKSDSDVIAEIFQVAQIDSTSYHTLRILSNQYGKRLAGTPASIEAIQYMKKVMENSYFDTVYLQECTVVHWYRGDKEEGIVFSNKSDKIKLAVCTLGNSVGTQSNGLKAEVVEVMSYEELAELGDKVKGKIVFFNEPMDPNKVNTFEAYGEVVGFRFSGASVAAKYGAEAVLVRSVTTALDTFPHTGVMRYSDTPKEIPAFSVSTVHANLLSKMLKEEPNLKLYLKSDCKFLPDEKSYNVVGEVKGSKFPNEFITVGGHLDSWDNSDGAHDDGGGCVQSIDVWRIFNDIGYKPQRTLRVVMFIDEEMNQRGGQKYAELAKLNNEKHIFAIESDGGCDSPLGFSFETDSLNFHKCLALKKYFEPHGINLFVNGGSGVDIAFLKDENNVLVELIADPSHYFDYHHSGYDTFDKIDRTSLQQGSAAMASLIYLVDKYGFDK